MSSSRQMAQVPLCASQAQMRGLRQGSLQFFTKGTSVSVLPLFLAEYPHQARYYRPAEPFALDGQKAYFAPLRLRDYNSGAWFKVDPGSEY